MVALSQRFARRSGDTVRAGFESPLDTLALAEVKAKLAESGVTVAPMNRADLRAFVKPQATLYRDIAQSAKITTE